ncbi:MAG: hypothetical protein KC684_10185 [Candidatus Omnitrophica bacterium]|nr:hypothetical protein [Candidatus Omnitrophota bacterium]
MGNPSKNDIQKFYADPESWKYGCIYYCPGDPRIIVPKRLRWTGWTINFAHPRAWVTLTGLILFAVLPPLFVLCYSRDQNLFILTLILVILGLCFWSHHQATKYN